MIGRWTSALLALGLAAAPGAAFAADEESFDPATGYRVAHYRGAVPATVPGGTRIDLEKLDGLLNEGAVLLDVMPSEGAGPDPANGAWRLSRPH